MQDQGANVAWQHLNGLADGDPINYSEIDCVINDEYKVACRREGQEVYLPFSFVGKYFEVSVIFPVILFRLRQEIKGELLQGLTGKNASIGNCLFASVLNTTTLIQHGI